MRRLGIIDRGQFEAGAVTGALSPFAARGVQELKEPLSCDPEGLHVGPDNILAELLCHLDHAWASHSRLRHDEMVALDSILDAAEELAHVPQLLPGDSFHAPDERSATAW